MREIALSKNGICLSAEYHNEREPLEWECAIGHRWMAKPRAISRQGTWCPVCAVEKRRSNRLSTLKTRRDSSQNDLYQVKEFARRLGGEYLSNNMPVNPDEKMEWQCGAARAISGMHPSPWLFYIGSGAQNAQGGNFCFVRANWILNCYARSQKPETGSAWLITVLDR